MSNDLPAGYRWATEDETEAWGVGVRYPGERWIKRTADSTGTPYTQDEADLAVPDDVIDFTPEMRAEGLDRIKRYKWAPTPFVPSVAGNTTGLLGAITMSQCIRSV